MRLRCQSRNSLQILAPRGHEISHGIDGGGGGNSLRPYSQQRPMRTNRSRCLGLMDNGQYKSTNSLLVLVPHERPHGIMRILENLCMLLPKALKMRTIKDTMALVADSIGGTKSAPAQMSWHLRHLNFAPLNQQGMMDIISIIKELCW